MTTFLTTDWEASEHESLYSNGTDEDYDNAVLNVGSNQSSSDFEYSDDSPAEEPVNRDEVNTVQDNQKETEDEDENENEDELLGKRVLKTPQKH